MAEDKQLTAADFAVAFKIRMIQAYPLIAEMTADQLYFASNTELDGAFERILNSANLRRTCEMEYERRNPSG